MTRFPTTTTTTRVFFLFFALLLLLLLWTPTTDARRRRRRHVRNNNHDEQPEGRGVLIIKGTNSNNNKNHDDDDSFWKDFLTTRQLQFSMPEKDNQKNDDKGEKATKAPKADKETKAPKEAPNADKGEKATKAPKAAPKDTAMKKYTPATTTTFTESAVSPAPVVSPVVATATPSTKMHTLPPTVAPAQPTIVSGPDAMIQPKPPVVVAATPAMYTAMPVHAPTGSPVALPPPTAADTSAPSQETVFAQDGLVVPGHGETTEEESFQIPTNMDDIIVPPANTPSLTAENNVPALTPVEVLMPVNKHDVIVSPETPIVLVPTDFPTVTFDEQDSPTAERDELIQAKCGVSPAVRSFQLYTLFQEVSHRTRMETEGLPEYQARVWIDLHDPVVPCIGGTALQRYMLAVLFFSWNGPETWHTHTTETWMTAQPECDWYGLDCDADDHVTHMVLKDVGIEGMLPRELFSLRSLRQLSLDHNDISGRIPSTIVQLRKLEILELDDNRLQGPIPSVLAGMDLKAIDLNDNMLTGGLPDNLGRWTNLLVLQLENNLLTSLPGPSTLTNDLIQLIVFSSQGNNVVESVYTHDFCDTVVTRRVEQPTFLQFLVMDCSSVEQCPCCVCL